MVNKWKKTIAVLYTEDTTGFLASTIKHNIEKLYADYSVVTISESEIIPKSRATFGKKTTIFGLRHIGWINKLVSTAHSIKNSARIRRERRELTKKVDESKKRQLPLDPAKRLVNLINRLEPVAIICMIHGALDLCIDAKRQTGKPVNIVCTLNDFVLDKYYVSYNIDSYLVNHAENRKSLMRHGISEEKIFITGMPSQKSGILEKNKQTILEKYGINNTLPIVVLDGGNYGYYYTKENFLVLADYAKKFNLLLLASGNGSLRMAFNNKKKEDVDELLNLYLIEERNEAEMLRIANVYITPPNPMIMYSAFELNIPVIMTSPISSKERGDFAYVSKKGYAIPAKRSDDIASSVEDLLANKNLMENTANKAKEYIEYVKDFKLPKDGSFLPPPIE